MTGEKNQAKNHTKTKFHVIFWTVFFALLGGILATFLWFLISFLIAGFILDSKGIGLGIFLYPYVLASSILLSSYAYLRCQGINKHTLRREYSLLIGLIILSFSAYYLFNFSIKRTIRPRYTDFAKALHEDDYSTAFSFMSPVYREAKSPEDFEDDAYYLYVGDQYNNWPPLWTIDIHDFGRKATINYNAWSYLDFERTGSTYLFLEKIDGIWYFTGDFAWGGG